MATKSKAEMSLSTTGYHVSIGAQSNDHTARLAGIPTRRFFTDAAAFVDAQLLVTDYYRFDAVSNFWDVYNIEAEALGQPIVYHPGGIPDADRTRPLLRTPADLDRLAPPDPCRSGRMPWVLQVNRRYLEKTGRLDRAFFTAPFSLAVNIRGYENLVTDMFARPDFVHRLFHFLCDDVLAPYVAAMRTDAGIPDLLMDGRDAWASPPMISLAMMDEYVVPYTERLRKAVGGHLITRGNWGDAKSRDPERFFAQKLRCSPGSLSVLDPDLHDVGPQRVKAFARRHNVAVAAGVDATLLKKGPVEAIVDRVRHYVETLGCDGRCTLHLNQIAAETPPEHVHAAVAACHAFDRRPAAPQLSDILVQARSQPPFADFMRLRRGSPDHHAG